MNYTLIIIEPFTGIYGCYSKTVIYHKDSNLLFEKDSDKPLILRHGKNGDFYGSPKYPKSKFTYSKETLDSVLMCLERDINNNNIPVSNFYTCYINKFHGPIVYEFDWRKTEEK